MRHCIAFLLVLISLAARAQSTLPVTERIVSLNYDNRRVDEVLRDISAQGKFEFVWASNLFDASRTVSLHEKNITVRRAIYLLFGNSITYKVRNDYIILQPAPAPIAATETSPRKKEYTLSGYIVDANTGIGISYASVYDSASLASTLSDYYGFYTLKLNGSTQPVNLKVSREYYSDTAFSIVPSSNLTHDISIYHTPEKIIPVTNDSIPKTDTTTIAQEQNVESFPFLDSLIGFDQLMQSRNMKEFLKRGGQVSLLPFISTNGKLTGNVVNKFSLNVIGGYTAGTDGLEIGGALNIDRRNVNGVQIAGGANVVGGNVKGIQTSGALNFTMGSLRGLQLSGGSNFLMDTLRGVQLAGGTNVNRGKIYGGQIAGGVNIAMRDLDGFQLSGGLNFTNGTVKKFQATGGLNYAGQTNGFQLAGGANISADTVKGMQLAGGFNFARHMNGTQIAVLNIAQESKGFQLGVLNIADTCNGGIPIGMLSIVRKGLHQVEISATESAFLNIAFRTGVPAFHTILTAGFDPQSSAWTFGYGFGHDFRLGNKFNINLDGYVQHYNPSRFADYTNEWAKIDLLLEWKPVRYIGIAAGPTFNYFITGTTQDELQPLHSKPIFKGAPAQGYQDYGWIGAKFAIRFF
ncbi:MAG: hypothetical protein M3R17_20650 [Bacteroidota bacterium]|nr:hypothetical protein [Bacteroidota bacterium]